jgi:hypothetical protein
MIYKDDSALLKKLRFLSLECLHDDIDEQTHKEYYRWL